jgi:hypothetical protein
MLACGSTVVAGQTPDAGSPPPATAAMLDLCWDPVIGREQEPCEAPPGRYAPSLFMPAVEFDLDAGWKNYRSYPDAFALYFEESPSSDLTIARAPLRGTVDPTPGDPDDWDRDVEVPIGEGVSGVVDYLANHPVLEVVAEPVDTTVGGLPTTVIDVEAPHGAYGLFLLEQDAYGLGPGDRLRAWIVDHPESTLLILSEVYPREEGAMAEDEDITAVAERIEPIIAAMAFRSAAVP